MTLLLTGCDLEDARVSFKGRGLAVSKIEASSAGTYLMVEVSVDADASPGEYHFQVAKALEGAMWYSS